jgi:nucleotide-binding universal stress UspA family protein
MAFAKILVPITGSPTDGVALATAFAAAKPFQAHVAALFVHPDPREVLPIVYSGMRTSPQLIQSIVNGQLKLSDEAMAAARSTFTAVAKDFGAKQIPSPVKSEGPTCSFRSRFGFAPHLVHEEARYADVVVFKPVSADERREFASAIVETLVKAGRPVLLSAQQPVMTFARHVAIAWDGRDSAARAATAALPYLKEASSVDILTVQPDGHGAVAGADALRTYLSLHGVNTGQRNIEQQHESVGARLLEAAAQTGTDLLVMGGYGHSHLRETVVGGVTLDIVSHHTLPVFLMH